MLNGGKNIQGCWISILKSVHSIMLGFKKKLYKA